MRNVFSSGPLRLIAEVARPIGASAVLATLAGCRSAILDPHGPVGGADKTILIDSLAIMLAIVVPTIIVALGFAWWFRATNKRATYRPTWEFSGQIELVVWSIPLMVITLLGGVAWIGSHELDPAKRLESNVAPLEIQIVSLDWKWLFIYPDQKIATINALTVPANVPLHLTLTSSSVMNAFFVPQLGSMIYTMAGMTTELNLSADHAGTFRGMSAHYSGEGFSDMHFEVHVVGAEEFNGWIEKTRAANKPLNAAAYAALSEQSIAVAPSTYSAVDADLFKHIVSLAVPPGPGPATTASGASQAAMER